MNDRIIRNSNSTFASPAFLLPKKDGEVCLFIDYRKLNELTVKEQYPLPKITDIFNQLHGAKIFSQIDLNSGNHQIEVASEDKHKTSFVTPIGQFKFDKMPFGATNAPRSFQRTMNSMFRDYDYVKVCLDVILIHSRSEHKHINHTEKVLEILKQNGFTINAEKSNFGTTPVKYLGCIISSSGIRPHISKMSQTQFRKPNSIRQLQKILDFLNYFRPFVKDFSRQMIPMADKLRTKGEKCDMDQGKRQNFKLNKK